MLSRRILGVDVGSTSIKLAQAEESPFGKRTLRRLALSDDLESFADLLNSKTWWTPGDQLHLSFPSDQVVVRNLRLPFRDQAKIHQTLPFELEGDIPFPVEEILSSCLVREKSKEGADILALASTKEAVASWLDRFRPLGLDPASLEPELAALSHLIPRAAPNAPSTYGILDMGASKTNFLLIHNNRVQAVRCIRRGLGPSDAEVPLPEPMMQEIDRTLKMLRSQVEVPWMEAMYTSGGGSDVPGVPAWLESLWNIPVRMLSPLDAAPSALSEEPEMEPARFSTAIGLALSEERLGTCNLRVGPFAYRPGLSMYRGRALAAGVLVILAIVLGLGDLYAHLTTRQKALQALKEETHSLFRKAFPEVTQIVDPALQMRRLIEEKKTRQFGILAQDPRGSSVEMLREISLKVQPSMSLRLIEFDLNEDMISIRGEADAYKTIEKAKDRLEESPLIEEVEVKTAKRNPKTQLWEFQCVARRKFS